MAQQYPLIIGGEKVWTQASRPVYNKYDGSLYASISVAGKEEADRAVAAAKAAFQETYFDVAARSRVLLNVAQALRDNVEELAEILVRENGKTVQGAQDEIIWTTDIFVDAAEEAKRICGETVCMPQPGLDKCTCYVRREPVGVVAAITPFNFPVNLAAHKVAPALAAGNPFVLKPAEATSVVSLRLCELILEAGAPPGFVSCLTGPGKDIGGYLTQNPDISFYSFTGSVAVGRRLRQEIGVRKCSLELGSNAATIVCADYDLDSAAAACADAAFNNAGQICISLQRIYVQREVYEPFVGKLAALASKITAGDPADPKTEVGPLISLADAERAMSWIAEAVAGGAVAHCGNRREGSVVWPTVLTGVTRDMKVVAQEAFAPIVSVIPFDTAKEAFGMVNDSPYGLSAGIFTHHMPTAMEAVAAIKSGSVIVGGTCLFRMSNTPYGGVKDSGLGREGPKYAIEEMTDAKTVVLLA